MSSHSPDSARSPNAEDPQVAAPEDKRPTSSTQPQLLLLPVVERGGEKAQQLPPWQHWQLEGHLACKEFNFSGEDLACLRTIQEPYLACQVAVEVTLCSQMRDESKNTCDKFGSTLSYNC